MGRWEDYETLPPPPMVAISRRVGVEILVRFGCIAVRPRYRWAHICVAGCPMDCRGEVGSGLGVGIAGRRRRFVEGPCCALSCALARQNLKGRQTQTDDGTASSKQSPSHYCPIHTHIQSCPLFVLVRGGLLSGGDNSFLLPASCR